VCPDRGTIGASTPLPESVIYPVFIDVWEVSEGDLNPLDRPETRGLEPASLVAGPFECYPGLPESPEVPVGWDMSHPTPSAVASVGVVFDRHRVIRCGC
jgi:hypothetical protein